MTSADEAVGSLQARRLPQARPPITGAAALVLVVLASGFFLLVCGRTGGPLADKKPHDPLADKTLYVESTSPAALQIRQWEQEGRGEDAEALRKIATQPMAVWVADPTP